jgi:uncharacterized protein (DUF4415 family)
MKKNGIKFGSDFAKIDAHIIQPHEYEELPELTDAMLEAADIYENGVLIRRGRGRPKLKNPKREVKLRVDSVVEQAYRATGKGWQTRMNAALAEYAKMHGML